MDRRFVNVRTLFIMTLLCTAICRMCECTLVRHTALDQCFAGKKIIKNLHDLETESHALWNIV